MSFDLTNIREFSNEPQAKLVNQLAKKLSKFLTDQQTQKLENKEDVYSMGQDVDTVVRYHSDLSSTKSFAFNTIYYPPFEPDGDKVKLWIKGQSLGNTLPDLSSQGMTVSLIGDPILVNGTPFDYGIHTGGTKSIALRFNRPTSDLVNQEYISVTDHTSLQIAGLTTGISYFIRFRVSSIASQGGLSRTVFEKIDNNTPTDGVVVKINDTGKLQVVIERGDTQYKYITDNTVISINTVYDLWVTYTVSGNVVKVYINNVDVPISVDGTTPGYHATLTNHNLSIFRRGEGSTGGYLYGDLYDFLIYKERVVTAAEVGYHYTNKWTIANIPYGQVAVTNYFATWTE